MHGDLARLVQSFGNVMTNAAKYTRRRRRDPIHVCSTEESVKVEISDTGTGISADFIPRIFDLFTQADRTLDRAQGGLGIGLSVVKKLVEMHGGRYRARSEGLGRGSTFESYCRASKRPRRRPSPRKCRGALAPHPGRR